MTVTVAYLGPAGTFTEAALWKFHEQTLPDVTVQPLPVDSPAMALDAVRSGDADYACVAIENSVDGPVTPTFDALAAAPGVQIYGETDIDITFAIMMRPGFESATIRTFSTHPVARQQVAGWVADNLPE
ncbi:prephenate dehydratase domain-containing protein, partial [Corynebacterium durum]